MFKKQILVGLLALSFVISPLFASADAVSDLQAQIQSLLATINSLQAQLSVATGGTSTSGQTSSAFCYKWSNDLTVGSRGADVRALNEVLSKEDISERLLSEIEYFDENTAGHVVKFQTKYGIRQTGYVGPMTRAKLNVLYRCVNTTTPSITILSPNGGEIYTLGNGGSPIEVRWNTNNVPSSYVFDVVRIRSYSSGQEYILAMNVLNDGQEVISIPSDIPVGAYTLEMKSYVNNVLVTDGSNSYFKIVSTPINDQHTISFPQSPVSFTAIQGDTALQQKSFTVTNSSSISVSFIPSIIDQPTWLKTASNLSGPVVSSGKSATITISVNPTGLAAGTYSSSLSIGGDFAGAPVAIPITVTILPKPTISNATASLTANLNITNEDRVGMWNVFGPGKAYMNQNPADYGFRLDLSIVQSARTIKSITVFHNKGGEGWATSRDLSIFGADPYPLVVRYGGSQVNTRYDTTLGTYQPGSHTLMVYGQPESTPFGGGKAVVNFTDGTSVSALIAPTTLVPKLPEVAVAAQPSITVVSPNGGEIITQGQRNSNKYQISWTGTNLSRVTAFLVPANSAGNGVGTLGVIGSVSNIYSDMWWDGMTVWSDLNNGTAINVPAGNYKIYLVGNLVGGGTLNDMSDSYFTTVPPVVVSAEPVFSFSQTSFNFTANQGDTQYQQKSITFTNKGNTNAKFAITISNQPKWLNTGYNTATATAYPNSPVGIGASLDPQGLTVGTYSTNLVIVGDFVGSPMTIPVTATILPQATVSGNPTVSASPTNVSSGGTSVISFTMPNNTVSARLTLACSSGVSAKGFDSMRSITGTEELCGKQQSIGIHTSGVEVVLSNGTASIATVTANFSVFTLDNPTTAKTVLASISVNSGAVSSAANITFPKTPLVFNVTQGSTLTQQKTFVVTNTGSVSGTFSSAVFDKPTWLQTAISLSGTSIAPNASATVTVTVNPTGLAAGTYSSSLSTSGSFTGSPVNIPITLVVSPMVSAGTVLNPSQMASALEAIKATLQGMLTSLNN